MINMIKEKYETLDELEQGGITYLKIAFDKMFNMINVVITSLHDFIKNFFKDDISKVPNKNNSALTKQMNAVCERLSESNELPCKDPVHVLLGITWCSVTEFVGPFELLLNTEHVR